MDEKKGEAILPEEPQTETAAKESPKGFTRRQVVAGGIGVGLVGLIAGGALAKWGVIEDTIASGRCAVQCPNGAIKFVDWQDIAQEAIDKGIVRTSTLFPEA